MCGIVSSPVILRSPCKCLVPVYETYRHSDAWIQGHSLCPPGKNWPCAPRPLCVQWRCPAGRSYWRHPCCGSVCVKQNRIQRNWNFSHVAQLKLIWGMSVRLLCYVESELNGAFPNHYPCWVKRLTGDSCASPTDIWAWQEGSHWCLGSSLFGGTAEGPWSQCPSLWDHRPTLNGTQWHEMGWKVLLPVMASNRMDRVCSIVLDVLDPEHLCVGRTSCWRITIPH